MKSVSLKPIRYWLKINFLTIQYCYTPNRELLNDRKHILKVCAQGITDDMPLDIHSKYSKDRSPVSKSSSTSQFPYHYSRLALLSCLLNKILDILYTSFFPQMHKIKFLHFFLLFSVIFYNLDPIFKPHNDGFNLIYREQHWIDVKRLGRLNAGSAWTMETNHWALQGLICL